eukprot:GHVL01038147.1.p1 GENE.GHVL01038147.1~~GHVL01038147.1.p1  ORF type:complete len:346 (+),score=44.08 GHVL01038147.1:744-1781(+)
MWKALCDTSRIAFEEIYAQLQVKLTERGESFYNDMIPGMVKNLKERGLVVESQGAMCLFTSASDVPMMIVKKDGGYGYDTTDICAIYHRLITSSADWVIYVTDLGQENHFMQLFDAAIQAGWHEPPRTRLDHVGFGLVQAEDGSKFRTRCGKVVRLRELLDEAKERAINELKSRKAGAVGDLPADEWEKAASAIGYAAIKYFDLRQRRTNDYKFSFDAMLENKGNTAVYMMYAYARICGIIRKCENHKIQDISPSEIRILCPVERQLAVKILQFHDVMELILKDLFTHRLAEYMYDLSEKFNLFYNNCKVLGSEEEKSRLLLCELTRRMLNTCFNLLGINPLDRI